MTRRRSLVPMLLAALAILVVVLAFSLWLGQGRNVVQHRLPGRPEAGPPVPLGEDTAFVAGGELVASEVAVPDMVGAWPRFRGASSDAVCRTPGGSAGTD